MKNVTRKCCDDGVLAGGVVKAISNSSVYADGWTRKRSKEALDLLFGQWPFPKSWSRNLKHQNHFPMKEDLIRTNQKVFGRGAKRKERNLPYWGRSF